MKAYQTCAFLTLAALLSGCSYMESLVYYEEDGRSSVRNSYGVTQDTGSRADFPVSCREGGEDSRVEWVHQPRVSVPEPPVVTHGNP